MTETPTPMEIGEIERVSLRALRIVAAERPVDVLALMRHMGDSDEKTKYTTQMAEQSVYIPLAFLVTYSVKINHPIGTARHMSISSQVPGRIPAPESVWKVAQILGFEGGLGNCQVYKEELQRGREKAVEINVIQPIMPGTEPHLRHH